MSEWTRTRKKNPKKWPSRTWYHASRARCNFKLHIACIMMDVIISKVASFFAPFSLKYSLSPQFSHLAIFPSFFDHSSLYLLDFHLFCSNSSTKYMKWYTFITRVTSIDKLLSKSRSFFKILRSRFALLEISRCTWRIQWCRLEYLIRWFQIY